MPAVADPSRTSVHSRPVRRQPAGVSRAVMARKYTAPARATGMRPHSIDSALVVTRVQLMTPVLGQDSAAGSV